MTTSKGNTGAVIIEEKMNIVNNINSDNNEFITTHTKDTTAQDAERDTRENDTDRVDKDMDDNTPHISGLPVDEGWAWMVLAAAVLYMVVWGGIMKSYGLFFIQYQKRFGSTASETTIMSTVGNVTGSVTGVLIMSFLLNHITCRTSIFIGTCLSTVGYIITAFATDIRVLNFSIGIMVGVGGILVYLPVMSMVSLYFNKRRGLANSLTSSGAALGGLVFGPLYTTLFDSFGYTGTLLFVAGFMFNVMITGALMRPVEYYTTRTNITTASMKRSNNDDTIYVGCMENEIEMAETEINNTLNVSTYTLDSVNSITTPDFGRKNKLKEFKQTADTSDQERQSNAYSVEEIFEKDIVETQKLLRAFSNPQPHNLSESSTQKKRLAFLRHLEFSRTVSYDSKSMINADFQSPIMQRVRANTGSNLQLRKGTFSENSYKSSSLDGVIDSICKSKFALYSSVDVFGSVANIYVKPEVTSLIKSDTVSQKETLKKREAIKNKVVTFFKTIFDIKLLKDPVFIHCLMMSFVCLPASVLPNVFIIPFGKDIKIPNKQLGIILTVIGCVDLFSRIVVGIIADKKRLKSTTLLAVAMFMLLVLSNLLRFVTNYWILMVYVIIQSTITGVYMCLFAVILAENIGMERFKSALGFTGMIHGATMALFFPVTGLLRDKSCAYYMTFHMLSGIQLVGAVLAITLPLTRKCCNEKHETDTK